MQILKDLWADKPVFFTVVAAIAGLLFLLWKNSQGSAITAAAATSNMQPDVSGSTLVEYSYYNNTPVSNVTNTTVPATSSTPVASAPGIAKPSTGKPAPSHHTVTVTPWPSKNSTLYGIAQSVYGNGNLWPKIYQANKQKIGGNPNLIFAGTVLTIP